jgi:hypothetical protein
MDAIVYEERASRSETGGVGAREATVAGDSGVGGTDVRPRVFGCGAAGEGGAGAIFERILNMTREAGEWLLPDRSCEGDSDCRTALLTPVCDVESALCTVCQLPAERALYDVQLAGCIVEAIMRCCPDPAADQDCVFRDCVRGCGPQ